MNKEFEQVRIDFNNKARRIFFSLYENFKTSGGQLNRRMDENVFQQQQSKYLKSLKEQLETIARELIYNNRLPGNTDRLNKILSDEIAGYLNEFKQKTEAF